MKLIFTRDKMTELKADLVIVPVQKGGENVAFTELDRLFDGVLTVCAAREGFDGQKERNLIWEGVASRGTKAKIMCVGIGKERDDPAALRSAVARGVRHAAAHALETIAVVLNGGAGQTGAVRVSVEGAMLGAYRFSKYKSQKPKEAGLPKLCAVGVFPRVGNPSACEKAVRKGEISAEATLFARDLVNEPANQLSPEALADRARAMAKEKGLQCTVLGEKEIRRRGMALFLSVAQGSARSPRFIHLVYTPKKATKKVIALVGKGVTFDTGGLCIKPGKSMYGMKTDMAGAATVLGVMSALRDLEAPITVHGIIPATDNSVGGDSTRPGDVFTALSGKTVEVVNTDAEGRLILADALTYASRLNPGLIIDHATLTGACEVALGSFTAGLFSKRDEDAQRYLDAAESAGELLWRLPLSKELESGIRSDVADLKNVGPRWGGAITAALFLQHFTAGVPWMHLDIAGPARADKNTPLCPKGGTGFGVLTALSFLCRR